VFGMAMAFTSFGCGGGDDDDDDDDTDDDIDDDTDDDTEEPPAAPSDLTAAAVSDSEIELAWQDNSDDEDGFKIERQTGSKAWEEVAAVGADVESYTDSELDCGTEYTYRVYAFNDVGNSDYSNEASATTDECIFYGNVLKVYDPDSGSASAFYEDPNYNDNFNSGQFEVEYLLYWSDEELPSDYAGMAFRFWQNYSGTYYLEMSIDAYKYDGSPRIETLDASSGNWVVCYEPLEYNTWYTITVQINPDGDPGATNSTFSVLVNGSPTSCADFGFIWDDAPLAAIQFFAYSDYDGSNPSRLNIAYIDNIVITKDKAEIFAEDWEDDTVGDPPGDPWTYENEPNAYMEIIELE